MALAVSMQRIRPWVIALYKFLWHRTRSTLGRDVFASLFQRFIILLKNVCSKWQTCYDKQRRSKLPSSKPGTSDGHCVDLGHQASEHTTNIGQVVIPLDNISCSMYPYGTGLHDSACSSQILNSSRSSHNLGIISRSRNPSSSSHNTGLNHAQSPLGGGYTFTIQPTTPRRTYSTSLPELDPSPGRAADIHEAILQHRPYTSQNLPRPRSDSPIGSIQLLSPNEISSSHVSILPTSRSPIEQSTELPVLGTVGTSSQTYSDDLEIPALDHHLIYPVAPENFQRYNKRRRIQNKTTRVEMKPMVIDFSDRLDPPGWTLCTHPEGPRYFYNAAKRIFTDVDLYDSAFFNRIELHIEIIESFITRNHISIPEETDLVLDINLDENDTYVTDYYFANHQLRIIFFLDHFPSEHLPHWGEVKGLNSGRHLQHAIETQYWMHCELYPSACQLTDDLVCELRDIVMHFIGDTMTSPYANSPYTLDDLYKILSLTDGLKENVGKPHSGCTSLLSRLMFIFSQDKFYNFNGLPEARLNRDQSVYGTRTNQRTWFIRTVSIFLFSAPDIHLRILQKMWVDGLMHKAVWETSLRKLNDEWREFILYSTVLLNANVAFIGTPRIETLSAAQISSYFSISTSVGSIVLGLLLVRQNQTKNRDTAADAHRFLRSRTHPLLGLETLAIMFSLPYALLMWSMVSFLVAFLIMCFQDSSTLVRSAIGSLGVVITVLIVWCIWTSWEKPPDSDAESPEDLLSFEREDESEERRKGFTFKVVPEPTEEPQTWLPLPFTWPSFLPRRRQSCDSGTVVGDP